MFTYITYNVLLMVFVIVSFDKIPPLVAEKVVSKMPLGTLAVTGYELRVTFAALDYNGLVHTRDQVYELIAADDIEAEAARAAFLTDLGAATAALIVGSRLTKIHGTADAISQTAQLHKVAVMTLRPATAGKKFIPHNIIAPANGLLASGTTVDAASTEFADYIVNLQTGTSPGIAISDGERVAAANPLVRSRVKSVSSGISYTS